MQTHSLAKDFGTLAVMGVITFSISSAIYTNVERTAQLSALAQLAQQQALEPHRDSFRPDYQGTDDYDGTSALGLCGDGICENGEDRIVLCPSCAANTPPELCRCQVACEEDCRKDDRQPTEPDHCRPIECPDGSRHDACTANGHPINYFVNPCQTFDGDQGGDHEAAPLQPYCEDGDGGMDIFNASRTEQGGKIERDYCEGPHHVFEFFCKPGLRGERMKCPFGCKDGACLQEEQDACKYLDCMFGCSNGRCNEGPIGRPVVTTCKDSDGGNNTGTRGEVLFMDSTNETHKEDRCLDNNLLMEYYCSEHNDIQSAQMHCDLGCVNGRCLEEGSNSCVRMRCPFGCENGKCYPPPYDRELPTPMQDPYLPPYDYDRELPTPMAPEYYEPPYRGGEGLVPGMMNMNPEKMLRTLEMTSDSDLPPGTSREEILKHIKMMMEGRYPDDMDGPRGMPWEFNDAMPWDGGPYDEYGQPMDSDDYWDGDEYHNPWDKAGAMPIMDDGAPPAGYEDVVRVNDIESPSKNWFNDTELESAVGKAANVLADRAIIGGYPDGSFKEGNPVNRAEAAKFLLTARYGQVPDMQSDGRFWDIRAGEWYVKYVMYAANLGVIKGNPDGSFLPGNTVNTAEFLKMLSITFELETGGSHDYDDVPADAWFAKFAPIAQQYELFADRTASLEPQEPLTRGEVAVAIAKMLSQ